MEENKVDGTSSEDFGSATGTPTEDNQPLTTPSGEQVGTTGAAASELNSSQEPDKEKVERALAEYGKLSKVQKDYQELQDRSKKFGEWLMSSPERAKQALVEIDGLTEAEANQMIEDARRNNPNLWKNATSTQTGPSTATNLSPEEIRRLAADAARDQRRIDEGIAKFKTAVPNLDPNSDSDKQLLTEVEAMAYDLLKRRPDTDIGDAYIRAYKVLTGKSDEEIKAAREEGYTAGLIDRNVNQAATSAQPGGQSAPTRPQPKLNDYEKMVADRLIAGGLIKDYAEYADKQNA